MRINRRTGRNKTYAPGIEMVVICDVCNNSVHCICFLKDKQYRQCESCKNDTIIYNKMLTDPRLYKKAEDFFNDVILRTKCDGITHTLILPDTSHKGNGVHQGLFAGTLTMAPGDKYNEEDMVGAIKKIFAQQTVPVKKWAWYREYTKNGTPHIHFVYETESGGRIHKKIFQRYWKLWDEPRNQTGRGGFPGGYHSPAKSPTAYIEYISKDGGRRAFKGFEVQNEILMDK